MAPAFKSSIFSRPPAMELTRWTYCWAISVKMSVAGHEVCILSVTVCARETCGMAMVATPATAAPPRNLRRVAAVDSLFLAISLILPWIEIHRTFLAGVLFRDPTLLARIRPPLRHNRRGCGDRTQHWAAVCTPLTCTFCKRFRENRTKSARPWPLSGLCSTDSTAAPFPTGAARERHYTDACHRLA